MRELIRTNRISGMAYEPAWLAGEIATIYLPWLFASLLTRVRVTRFKWFELVLLGMRGFVIVSHLLARRPRDGCSDNCSHFIIYRR